MFIPLSAILVIGILFIVIANNSKSKIDYYRVQCDLWRQSAMDLQKEINERNHKKLTQFR